MGRLLTWLGGALGLAALWRFLRQEQQAQRHEPERDPAAELRAKLDEARGAADDRDEYDAAEGQPVNEVRGPASAAGADEPEAPEPPPSSLEERRRAIHEKAQQALGEMQRPVRDE
jgi:hypothetical protein